MQSYAGEIKLPLQKNLSAAETSRLELVTKKCDSLDHTLSEISSRRSEVIAFLF